MYNENDNNKNVTVPFNGNPDMFRIKTEGGQQPMQQPVYGQPMQQPVYGQPVNIPNQMGQVSKKKSGKKTGIIIAVVLLILLAAGGAATYLLMFTPEKRVERYISNGNDCYSSKDYEDALEQYDKALAIDDNNSEAIYMEFLSYDGMCKKDNSELSSENAKKRKEYFEAYLEMIRAMSPDERDSNMKRIKTVYLMADTVYEDNIERVITYLNEALEYTDNDSEIQEKLGNAYYVYALSLEDSEDYEKAIENYNLSYEYKESDSTISKRNECVKTLLNYYMDCCDYDAATALLDEYGGVADNINELEYRQRIDNIQILMAASEAVMPKAYEYMSTGNYEAMKECDQSSDAYTISDMMSNGHFLYAPDTDIDDSFTGTAVGLYRLYDGGYYFYYGEFVEGERSGHGVYYLLNNVDNNSYDIYDGEWLEDEANGYGVFTEHDGATGFDEIVKGNFVNGYEDGSFETSSYTVDGIFCTGSYEASNGYPVDITGNYPEDFFPMDEGRIAYCVLKSEQGEELMFYHCGKEYRLRLSIYK